MKGKKISSHGIRTPNTQNCSPTNRSPITHKRVKLLDIRGKITYIWYKQKPDKMPAAVKNLPQTNDTSVMIDFLNSKKWKSNKLFSDLKEVSNMTDNEIALILDISPKTFRSYKTSVTKLTMRIVEHAVALYALYKHGEKVFGSEKEFNEWLGRKNFYFDGKSPSTLLTVINGIKFIDSRLTALEYGDNV